MDNATKSILKEIRKAAASIAEKAGRIERAMEETAGEKQARLASLLRREKERLLAREEDKVKKELDGMKKVVGFLMDKLERTLEEPKEDSFWVNDWGCLCTTVYASKMQGYDFPKKWKRKPTDGMKSIIEDELRMRGIPGKVMYLDTVSSSTAVETRIMFFD